MPGQRTVKILQGISGKYQHTIFNVEIWFPFDRCQDKRSTILKPANMDLPTRNKYSKGNLISLMYSGSEAVKRLDVSAIHQSHPDNRCEMRILAGLCSKGVEGTA